MSNQKKKYTDTVSKTGMYVNMKRVVTHVQIMLPTAKMSFIVSFIVGLEFMNATRWYDVYSDKNSWGLSVT